MQDVPDKDTSLAALLVDPGRSTCYLFPNYYLENWAPGTFDFKEFLKGLAAIKATQVTGTPGPA